MYAIWYTETFGAIGMLEMISKNVGILLKNQCGFIDYMWSTKIYKYCVAAVVGSHNTA